jgi:hypothetical protein
MFIVTEMFNWIKLEYIEIYFFLIKYLGDLNYLLKNIPV